MRDVILDGRAMTSRAMAHDQLAYALRLPGYYGRNLDALHDCLTSIGEKTAVTLKNASAMTDALGGYGELIVRVFQEAAEENPLLSFTVVS